MRFQKNQIPNYLTYLRILLIVPIVTLMLVDSPAAYTITVSGTLASFSITWLIGAILFVLGALTDFFDGWLARKNHWISPVGKFLDPLADKIVINGVMVVFVAKDFSPAWILIIFLVRDILVDGSRMVLAKNNVVVAANIFGKLKTVVQFAGILLILFVIRMSSTETPAYYYYAVQNLLMLAACVVSIYSGWTYLWPNRSVLFSTKISDKKEEKTV